MTREEVKILLPIIQAFAEGKVIQTKNGDETWITIGKETDLNIESLAEYPDCFRIKPEPKYRPFKDADECWQEMLKHQPFGWVKEKGDKLSYELLACVSENDEAPISFASYGSAVGMGVTVRSNCEFSKTFNGFTFADGTPFGVKEGA